MPPPDPKRVNVKLVHEALEQAPLETLMAKELTLDGVRGVSGYDGDVVVGRGGAVGGQDLQCEDRIGMIGDAVSGTVLSLLRLEDARVVAIADPRIHPAGEAEGWR